MLFWLFVGAAIILKSLLEKLKDIQVGIVLSAPNKDKKANTVSEIRKKM